MKARSVVPNQTLDDSCIWNIGKDGSSNKDHIQGKIGSLVDYCAL